MFKYLLIVIFFNFPFIAVAHSPLEYVNPADGTNLEAPPSKIVMIFKSAAKLVKFDMRVINEDKNDSLFGGVFNDLRGEKITLSSDFLMKSNKRHEIPLPLLKTGNYLIVWRALSKDGHVISDEFSFNILEK